MTDNKILFFRLVKYLLIITYSTNILILSVIVIFGFIHFNNVNESVRNFKEDVKDFADSYNQDHRKYFGICLVVIGAVTILANFYFIFAAYVEKLIQNSVIAALYIFVTVLQLIYASEHIEGLVYSIWSDIVILVYVYLIDRNIKTQNRNRADVQNTDVETESEIDMI